MATRLFKSLILAFALSINSVNAQEQDYTITNGEISLPGTLYLAADKSSPIVVLVHGSGPNDRNETMGPNKPFKQLAEGLASFGISSLRYDKRTMLYKQGADTLTYIGETVEDAVQAVKQLKAEGYEHIYVAGHSQGGHCAPLIARDAKNMVDGIILLSGNVGNMETMLNSQLNYLGKQQGATDMQISQAKQQMLASLPAKWIEYDRNYYPISTLKTVLKNYPQIRWMVVQGGHDYQVTATDFSMWQMAFMNKATYYYGETLDHILRPLPNMATPQDYMKEGGEMDKEVIKAIAKFIKGE